MMVTSYTTCRRIIKGVAGGIADWEQAGHALEGNFVS